MTKRCTGWSEHSSRSRPGSGRRQSYAARGTLVAVLAWITLLTHPGPVPAQNLPGVAPAPSPTEAANPLAPEEIAARLAALRDEIATATTLASTAAPGDQKPAEDELRTLRAIETWLTQQRDLVEEVGEQTAANGASEHSASSVGPVSISALNELYERRLAAEATIVALEGQLEAERETLAKAKERLDKAETKRRTARERGEAAETQAEREDASRELRLRKLKSREAREQIHLRTLEVHQTQAEITAQEPLDAKLAAEIDKLQAALATGSEGAAPPNERLIRAEAALRRNRESVERELGTAEFRIQTVQKRFSRVDNPPAELVEELESVTALRDAKRREISIIDERLQHLETQGELLQHWEKVLLNRTSRDELAEIRETGEQTLAQIGEALVEKQGRLSALRQRIERLTSQIDEPEANPRISELLEQQRAALSHLLELQNADAAALASAQQLANRVLGDIRRRTGSLDFFDYARRLAGGVREVWQYEVTAIDDEPITVASLVLALILVVAGGMLSRRIANVVRKVSVDRFHVEHGAAAALETMAFYALLTSFTLFALRMVNFPLTAFTVLGGALAIGIGFGSQNVMNNFISGLILMLERPVRAQDVVEVDGMPGTIEQIGARSTQIRSSDGRHIIVPNSFFLESNVVNWTLSDELIRAVVSVGVIYGSPTRLVEKLIHQAADEDSAILRNPAPVVIFEAFADNSLNFDVYFWVRARTPMQVRTVQSRLRFRIDDLFREHDLVIAFPQRDVHLDTSSPLDIRMVRTDREEDDTRSPPD